MPRLRVSHRQGQCRLEMLELWQERRGVRRLDGIRRIHLRVGHALRAHGNTKAGR
jgi:hypothetical protein